MKIKNKFLASILALHGFEVKAELIIDDVNGVAITFPDISDISEIAQGVAVSAPDGTYTVANGADVIMMVVLAGVVDSVTVETPAAVAVVDGELDAEVAAVLGALSDEVIALKKSNAAVVAELKSLKLALKHDTAEGVPAAAADKTKQPSFKVIG